MQTLIFRNSKKRAIVLATLCSMFVAAGITILTKDPTPKAQMIGWGNCIFFGFGIFVAIWLLFDNRPRIVIDDSGIYDRTLGMGTIEWHDIANAELLKIRRECFIALQLFDEEKYLSRLKMWQRDMAQANQFFGFNRININLSSVACDPLKVLEAIKSRISRIEDS